MTTLLEPMTNRRPANEMDAGSVSSISITEDASRTLLSARGLHKTFGGQTILAGVDLDLRQGEVVLLRGENGSGKTTLLNILTGNLEPDSGMIQYSADDTPRAYRFPRRWWQELNPWDHFRPEFVANEGLGRTWQDIRLFGAQSLRDNIAVAIPSQPGENPVLALFAPRHVKRAEDEVRQKADAMLAQLGLAGRESSSADKISLGQSKRVAIARVVAAGARILLLDEPLAGLDQPGIRNVLDLLEAIVRDHSVTLVIVEHVFNLPQLAYLATADWLLKEGKLLVTKTAPTPEQSLEPTLVEQAMHPGWFDLLLSKDSEVTNEPLPRGATLTRIRSSDPQVRDQKPVLEIQDLTIHRGSRVVIGLDDERELSGFSFSLRRNEIAILHAPNGWGKTTLLEAVAGLCAPSSGEVVLNGRRITKIVPWRISGLGVRLVLSQGFLPTLALSEIASLARVDHVPDDFESDSDRAEGSLSGGEKQRYRLQLALSEKPDPVLLLLDEPFAGLDTESSGNIALKLKQLAGKVPVLIAHPSYQ